MKKNISNKELAQLYRQISRSLNAGVPLDTSFQLTITEFQNPAISQAIQSVLDKVQEGNSFAHTMTKYPSCFSREFINAIHLYEQSSYKESRHSYENTIDSLEEIADKLQETHLAQLKKRLLFQYTTLGCTFALLVYAMLLSLNNSSKKHHK